MKFSKLALLICGSTQLLSPCHSFSWSDISLRSSTNDLPDEIDRFLHKKIAKQVKFYTYFDWNDMHKVMLNLAEDYPELITLSNAQDEFGLPAAGGDNDCPLDDDFTRRLVALDEKYVSMGKRTTSHRRKLQEDTPGCKNWFLTIEDSVAHPEGSYSKAHLPTLFLSGTVHGNERVGPTAVLEFAALLLDAAGCEALPHDDFPGKDAPALVMQEWKDQVREAQDCRQELNDRGITDDERRWLARLATTRRIIAVPAANALGYFRNEREEEGIDPNSDFPFDLKEEEKGKCMETITARTINEIFRREIIQLAITFHSGTNVVAYNWGAPSFDGKLCPDHESQSQIARAFSDYGGPLKFWGEAEYDVGSMNDLVYPVRGGMEDWAYAGSWIASATSVCTPETYGGYAPAKTKYDDTVLRSFNVLVETGADKSPPDQQAGSDYDLFNPQWQKMGSGHVTRNIRVLAAMTDIVEPYLSIFEVNEHMLSDDIVPRKRRDNRAARVTNMVLVHSRGDTIIKWVVGGGVTIDQTALVYFPWNIMKVPGFDGQNQPHGKALEEIMKSINGEEGADPRIKVSRAENGKTKWHPEGPEPTSYHDRSSGLLSNPTFSASVTHSYDPKDPIAVMAFAIMDESWGQKPLGDNSTSLQPDLPPQSNLANARTDNEWSRELGEFGRKVEGRTHWFSVPVTLNIGKHSTKTHEMNYRIPDYTWFQDAEIDLDEIEEEIEANPVGFSFIAIMGVMGCAGLIIFQRELKRRRDRAFNQITTEIDGMEMRDVEEEYPADATQAQTHTID